MFYLIFCRSVWYYPLRLDNPLYYEVVFNQIAPDYLEGLLLVTPGEQLEQEVIVSHLELLLPFVPLVTAIVAMCYCLNVT